VNFKKYLGTIRILLSIEKKTILEAAVIEA